MGHRRQLFGQAVSAAAAHRRTLGFTIVEIMVVLVLGSVVAGSLYGVLRYQQRVHREQRAAIARHDALRLASAVLMADLMEASGAQGDFRAFGPDTLALRSPVGFAVVCAIDPSDRVLALIDAFGRLSASAGDSLLIYHPDGWLVRSVDEIASSSIDCPYAGGPAVELRLRLDASAPGVPIGAPVRAFHRYTYRLEKEEGSWWLARDDGTSTDALAGPFSEAGSGLTFAYFDANGNPTDDPNRVARVDLRLVAESTGPAAGQDTLTTSVKPRNQ